MREVEIEGGANEFEAVVVAVVIDQIERDEATARRGRLDRGPGLPAWVRAIRSDDPAAPREIVWPE